MNDYEALYLYVTAGHPPACPRCGGWDGPDLPHCLLDGWTHDTSCALVVYADDVCADCAYEMSREVSA